MTKTICLVYAISPIHAVSAISAILTRRASSRVSVVILVHWPGAEAELVKELTDIIGAMLQAFSFIERVVPITSAAISDVFAEKSMRKATVRFKKVIGVEHADELYYPHDVVGMLYQALSTVYGKARRICFGDAMGEVFEREVHLSYLNASNGSTPHAPTGFRALLANTFDKGRSIWREQARDTNGNIVLKDFPPHEAALILPVDQSGNFLKRIELVVPNKNTVLDVLGKCVSSVRELRQYIDDLLLRYSNEDKCILLTDNLAEGNFIDFDTEVEMYCTMLKEYCAPESIIFLKSHPGESLPRNEAIRGRLSGTFRVEELERRFKRYPIEMWKPLVINSKVICLSYPVLSLKYLYGVDAIQPMDEAFIEKWFPEWTWASFKNSATLYMEPLKRLGGWDGRSVLWSGSVAKQ